MTLGFSQQINGKPNFFIEKIWAGLPTDKGYFDCNGYYASDLLEHKGLYYQKYVHKYKAMFGQFWDGNSNGKTYSVDRQPKFHTIRAGHRWRAGMKIHPVIGNRTKNRFQFAPIILCVSEQDVFMTYFQGRFELSIGDRFIYRHEMEVIAINDGFESIDRFEKYFIPQMDKGVFSGQIIHWTDLTY